MNFTCKIILFTITFASLLYVGIGNADSSSSSSKIHVIHRDLRSDLMEFCKKTTNPTLCADTIEPHFLKSAIDPLKALQVEVEATLDETKKTIGIIGELLAKQDISKSVKDSLKICKDQYNSIVDAIKQTNEAIAKHDVSTAKFQFSAVLSFQASCKDAFEGLQNEFSFAHDSDTVYQLGGNCLDIIADMEKSLPKNDAPVVEQSPPSPFDNVIGIIP